MAKQLTIAYLIVISVSRRDATPDLTLGFDPCRLQQVRTRLATQVSDRPRSLSPPAGRPMTGRRAARRFGSDE
jgi:hypothetical protein